MPLSFKLNGNTGVIGAAVLVVATAAVLLWRVDTVEAEQEETEKRLDCIETNQRTLDENQRGMAADVEWMLDGVHALLDDADVPRTKRPAVKDTKMKEPD